MLTFPEHLCSLLDFCGVRVARSLVFCVEFWNIWYLQNSVVFLVIVLFVLLRFKAFVYPLGIFKLFCNAIAVTLFIYFYFESMKLYLMDYVEIDTSIFRGVRWNLSRKYLKKCGIILLNNTKYPTYISFQLSGIVD